MKRVGLNGVRGLVPTNKGVALLVATVLALVGGALVAAAPDNPDYNPAKAHHRPDGFRNLGDSVVDKPFSEFLRWQIERRQTGVPRPPSSDWLERLSEQSKPTVLKVATQSDQAALPERADAGAMRLTWIGHATMLLQFNGLNVLIDPILSERASPVSFTGPKRIVSAVLPQGGLPPIDVVLISHNHYDHLDEPTVRGLLRQPSGQPLFIVPLGIDRWLKEVGAQRTQALDWWDAIEVSGASIHLTPAQHWSTRSLWDRNRTLWGGFVVRRDGFSFYYSGDTGYSAPLFQQIAERFGGFDLAALPVGAYAPRWFMREQHIDPTEAVQVLQDVKARQAIGVHWGTFELADESLDEPLRAVPQALAAAGMTDDRLLLFRHGETRRFSPSTSMASQ